MPLDLCRGVTEDDLSRAVCSRAGELEKEPEGKNCEERIWSFKDLCRDGVKLTGGRGSWRRGEGALYHSSYGNGTEMKGKQQGRISREMS